MNKDMKKTIVFVALIAGLVNLPGQAQKNDRPEVLLEAAKQKATLEGDLKGAIKQYKDIATRFASNHAVAATALLRMAECYQQLNDAEWRKIYNEVILKYGDQKAALELARARLGGTAPRETVQSKIWSGAGTFQLLPSPDGRYIVYIPRSTQTSLVLHDLSSDTDRSLDLGGGGRIYYPRLTPDGRVIYTWHKDDAPEELRIVNLDGTGMRTLHSSGEYTVYGTAGVTADSKLASVGLKRADQPWQIGLVSLETGKLQILKNLDWRETYVGNFSSDGRWLVYSAQLKKGSPDHAVYVIATDGSAEYTVVPSGLRDDTPRFTPDGSRVVFNINRSGRADLWSVRVTNGKPAGAPEIAKPNIGYGVFAQDGSYYYSEFVNTRAEYIAEVDPSTLRLKNAPTQISDPFRNESVQTPYWSPDGKRLAYHADVAEDRFVIHDFDSGRDRELPTHTAKGSLSLVGWFADGKSLQVVGPPAGFRLVDTETQQERPISLTGANQPVASTDGKAVFYYTRDSGPNARLIRRDLETGADKELYRVEAPQLSFLAPSPDSRSLTFAFKRPGEEWPRLWILPLSGGEPRELLRNDGGSVSSAWTQDSRAILFVRSGEIWVQPIDGREQYSTGIHCEGFCSPSVSPDGGRIAFVGNTSTENVWMIQNLFPETSAAKR